MIPNTLSVQHLCRLSIGFFYDRFAPLTLTVPKMPQPQSPAWRENQLQDDLLRRSPKTTARFSSKGHKRTAKLGNPRTQQIQTPTKFGLSKHFMKSFVFTDGYICREVEQPPKCRESLDQGLEL